MILGRFLESRVNFSFDFRNEQNCIQGDLQPLELRKHITLKSHELPQNRPILREITLKQAKTAHFAPDLLNFTNKLHK